MVVACTTDLIDPAVLAEVAIGAPLYAVDCDDDTRYAWVVVPDGDGYRLGQVRVDGPAEGADLTRRVHSITAESSIITHPEQDRVLTLDDLQQWIALGLRSRAPTWSA